MARLTKEVRQQLLNQNEGFTRRTYIENRNSREERIYKISGGQLLVRAIGKTSWADMTKNGSQMMRKSISSCINIEMR